MSGPPNWRARIDWHGMSRSKNYELPRFICLSLTPSFSLSFFLPFTLPLPQSRSREGAALFGALRKSVQLLLIRVHFSALIERQAQPWPIVRSKRRAGGWDQLSSSQAAAPLGRFPR